MAVALELFANDGFNGTCTNKIATQVGVWEGLIFRHFENKNGLLDAIVQQATERIYVLIAAILAEPDPKKVVQKSIELPFMVPKHEYPYWKLQFKLKWENNRDRIKMKPFIDKLAWAFSKVEYPQAEQEATVLNHIVDSIATGISRERQQSQEPLREFLLQKYPKK